MISSELKMVVRLAYAHVKPETVDPLRVTGHQVRTMTASWAALGGVSVHQIMNACRYTSHNIVTSHYLRDIAWEDAQLFRLGLVVVAQAVMQPTVLQ